MENETKKTYKVITSCAATQNWEYEVEASSEEEAIEIATSGKVDPSDYWVSDDGWGDWNEVEVEEVRNEN
jgi:hypothetical protein